MDSADRACVRHLCVCPESSLVDDDPGDVIRTAVPALRLCEHRKCVVDRSNRRQPSVLRVGICGERDRLERSREGRAAVAFGHSVWRDRLRRFRILCDPSLFSLSVVRRLVVVSAPKVDADSAGAYKINRALANSDEGRAGVQDNSGRR